MKTTNFEVVLLLVVFNLFLITPSFAGRDYYENRSYNNNYHHDYRPYHREYRPYHHDYRPYHHEYRPYHHEYRPYYREYRRPYHHDYRPYHRGNGGIMYYGPYPYFIPNFSLFFNIR